MVDELSIQRVGKWIAAVAVATCLVLVSGCAGKPKPQPDAAVPSPASDTNRITSIRTIDSADAVEIQVDADRRLLFTAFKQPQPLALVVYFSDTVVDLAAAPQAPTDSLVSAIIIDPPADQSSAARLEIALRQDAPYKVAREDEGLVIRIDKLAAAAAPPPAKEPAKDQIPILEVVTPAAESSPSQPIEPATTLVDIRTEPLADGMKIRVVADGPIQKYTSFSLDDPPRIVFDFEQLASPHKKEQTLIVDNEWVNRIRHYGDAEKLRIVIETRQALLTSFIASSAADGLQIHLGDLAATELAFIENIAFGRDDDGRAHLHIDTSRPVVPQVERAEGDRFKIRLQNTRMTAGLQFPSDRSTAGSAVWRVVPLSDGVGQNEAVLEVQMRRSVPYLVAQTDSGVAVEFPTSAAGSDTPVASEATTPSETQSVSAAAPQPAPRPAAADEGVIVKIREEETYDLDSRTKRDQYTGAEQRIDIYRAEEKIKRYTGQKIALNFYDIDVRNIFKLLQDVSGENFAIDKDVQGRVTLALGKPIPWDQALDLVLKMNRLGKIYEGNIIRIATLETIQQAEDIRRSKLRAQQKALRREHHRTAFIPVNYASATDIKDKHIVPLLTKDENLDKDQWGKVSVDERLNMIILTDVPLVIKQSQEIVQKLDKVTPQVVIEARIVEANSSFSRDLGIEWSIFGGIAGDDPRAGIGPQRGFDVFDGTYGYNTAINFPNFPAGDTPTIGFNITKIAGSPFVLNAQLSAMEVNGEGRIVSSPQVLTLDNKKATITQGLEYPYFEESESGGRTVKFKDIDLELSVTPHITTDNRISILLELIKNDVSALVEGVPVIATKEAKTEFLMDDQETLVIGGIHKNTTTNAQTGLPWLSKIPVLGWLFKTDTSAETDEELLIFITPKIVQLEQRLVQGGN